jgi:hypothetical protein
MKANEQPKELEKKKSKPPNFDKLELEAWHRKLRIISPEYTRIKVSEALWNRTINRFQAKQIPETLDDLPKHYETFKKANLEFDKVKKNQDIKFILDEIQRLENNLVTENQKKKSDQNRLLPLFLIKKTHTAIVLPYVKGRYNIFKKLVNLITNIFKVVYKNFLEPLQKITKEFLQPISLITSGITALWDFYKTYRDHTLKQFKTRMGAISFRIGIAIVAAAAFLAVAINPPVLLALALVATCVALYKQVYIAYQTSLQLAEERNKLATVIDARDKKNKELTDEVEHYQSLLKKMKDIPDQYKGKKILIIDALNKSKQKMELLKADLKVYDIRVMRCESNIKHMETLTFKSNVRVGFNVVNIIGAAFIFAGAFFPPLLIVGASILLVNAIVRVYDREHKNSITKKISNFWNKFFGKKPKLASETDSKNEPSETVIYTEANHPSPRVIHESEAMIFERLDAIPSAPPKSTANVSPVLPPLLSDASKDQDTNTQKQSHSSSKKNNPSF